MQTGTNTFALVSFSDLSIFTSDEGGEAIIFSSSLTPLILTELSKLLRPRKE
jgi:hypothetical protein